MGTGIPEGSMTVEDFPLYGCNVGIMNFRCIFAKWLHARKDVVRSCFHRVFVRRKVSIAGAVFTFARKYQMYHNYRWTSKIGNDIFNAYPVFDWKTTDIWVANGRFGYDYNHLYDLYYKAGVNIERQA